MWYVWHIQIWTCRWLWEMENANILFLRLGTVQWHFVAFKLCAGITNSHPTCKYNTCGADFSHTSWCDGGVQLFSSRCWDLDCNVLWHFAKKISLLSAACEKKGSASWCESFYNQGFIALSSILNSIQSQIFCSRVNYEQMEQPLIT